MEDTVTEAGRGRLFTPEEANFMAVFAEEEDPYVEDGASWIGGGVAFRDNGKRYEVTVVGTTSEYDTMKAVVSAEPDTYARKWSGLTMVPVWIIYAPPSRTLVEVCSGDSDPKKRQLEVKVCTRQYAKNLREEEKHESVDEDSIWRSLDGSYTVIVPEEAISWQVLGRELVRVSQHSKIAYYISDEGAAYGADFVAIK